MKKYLNLWAFLFLLSSCHQKITPEDIAQINGYWEIEKVTLPNGTKKEYSINETIDYFEIKNKKGFRKKVMPQFNGHYLVNKQLEAISITEKEGKTFIYYVTPYAKWHEQIIEISKNKLILENEQKITYYYKRQIPFSLK